jgi:hypothetical protein
MSTKLYLSLAHDESDIARFLEAAGGALRDPLPLSSPLAGEGRR